MLLVTPQKFRRLSQDNPGSADCHCDLAAELVLQTSTPQSEQPESSEAGREGQADAQGSLHRRWMKQGKRGKAIRFMP